MPDVKTHPDNKHMESHADHWVLERLPISNRDNTYDWAVLESVESKGTHPVSNMATNQPRVWVKRFSGPEADARAFIADKVK
jgi:hypothetical protein